jgi:hypothetical protein
MYNWLVISYFTAKTPYKKEAARLEESMLQLTIPHHVAEVPNLGDWQKNTHFKARFIRQMMDRFPTKDLIWVDADAVFHHYPVLFDSLSDMLPMEHHVAAHFRNWKHGKNELLSGTLFFNKSDLAKRLVDDWIRINKQNPSTWEQRNLARAIKREPLIDVLDLPIEYCCIFDDDRRKQIDPVIEHFQASRRLRRMVG